MDMLPEDVEIVAPPGSTVDATILAGPATVPACRFADTVPSNPVLPLGAARVEPAGPYSVKETETPAFGLPFVSLATNVTSEDEAPPDPETPITSGIADMNSMLCVAAALTVISTVFDTGPAVAVITRLPLFEGSAVNVTEATPPTVVADVAERVPALLAPAVIANVTVVPSDTGLFKAFLTVAIKFVVWPFRRLGFVALTVIEAGSLVMFNDTFWEVTPVAAPWIFTTPDDVPA
jgi:hypothetical protein